MKFPLQKILSWSLAHTAWLSMAFSPLALAQNNTLTTRKIENDLKDIGYNHKMTLGEFWEKTKSNYPDSVIQYFDKTIAENKNILMPDIQISSVKNTDGNEVPALRLSQNGKTQLLQIFGEKKKWAKLNNVNLSEADLFYPAVAMKRIESSDVNIRKAAEKYRQQRNSKQSAQSVLERKKQQQMSKDFARFTGFPHMTPQLWKSMTKEQRAGFIVRMRLLWLNARLVLETAESATPARGKPSAQSTMFEEMYRRLVGETAWAEDGVNTAIPEPESGPAPAGTADLGAAPAAPGQAAPLPEVTAVKKLTNVPYTANACVVAGYIGKYGEIIRKGKKSFGCSYDLAFKEYYDVSSEIDYVKKANEACKDNNPGKSTIACNPIIYGYPKGKEICIDPNEDSFQKATHTLGPCEKASPLSSSEKLMSFSKDYSDIQPLEKRIALIEADQKQDGYKMTKDFLEGFLTKTDSVKSSKLTDAFLQGKWTHGLDEELVRIQSHFENEIKRATEQCRLGIQTGSNEKNQKPACDQLHRRWLFTERFIADLRSKMCEPSSRYIGAYDSDELSTDEKAKNKSEINRKKIDASGKNLCECQNVTAKYCNDPKVDKCIPAASTTRKKIVSFGEKCVAESGLGACPTGMSSENPNGSAGDRRCVCDNGAAGMYTESEAKAKGAAQLCAATQPAGSCSDAPKDKTNFDAGTCSCKEGYSLQSKYSSSNNDSELGINASNFPPGKKPQSDEMVCRATSSFPWPWLVPPVLLGLFFLNKNKNKKEPKPPVDNCAPKIAGTNGQCTCSPASVAQCAPPQGIYDWAKCECGYKQPITCPDGSVLSSNKPNQLESCPKCPDNQYRTAAGCANESEGGKACTNPNGCGGSSGGIPTSTGQ